MAPLPPTHPSDVGAAPRRAWGLVTTGSSPGFQREHMINKVLTKIFGSQHEREVKKMLPMVAAGTQLEPEIKALSDDALRGKPIEFRRQLADGASLDDILAPAF